MSASILSVKDFIQFLQRDEESKEFDLHLVLIIVDEFMGSLKSYKQWLKKWKFFEASYSGGEDESIKTKEARMKKEIKNGDKDDDKIK